MQAAAIAQPNIALIKYWGKRDVERNVPAVGSISVTLRDLHTRMVVTFDDGNGAAKASAPAEVAPSPAKTDSRPAAASRPA